MSSVSLIRKMLTHFNDTEIDSFVLDYYPDLFMQRFGRGVTPAEKINYLLEYAVRNQKIEELSANLGAISEDSENHPTAQIHKNTMEDANSLIFISYASEDRKLVNGLYTRLEQDGFFPWMDRERIIPGQDWEYEITKAMNMSKAILLCFSTRSIQKEGFIQREYKRAMKYQEEKPEGVIFVIPVRLDNCEMPTFIRHLHWVDYPDQYNLLVTALAKRIRK